MLRNSLWIALLPSLLGAQDRVYPYLQVDVFTNEVLSGNQLAVFIEPEGMSDEEMQLVAREMAFSETTFVFPPETDGTDFRVRIFSPEREMAFAGHPTIGTAYALARAGRIDAGTESVVLEEGIGPVPVELEWEGGVLEFAWMHQREPKFGKRATDVAGVAKALGVEASAIEATGLPVQEVDCGSAFVFVPMASRAAVDRAEIDRAEMAHVLEASGMSLRGVFLFSSEPAGDGATVYSRMFGRREDPATGSASGPLGAYLVHHGVVPREKAGEILSRQGVKMGRPSRVHIRIGLEGDAIKEVLVGGATAFAGTGTLHLPPR